MKIKNIAYTAMGVALYVVLSMALKIPFPVGHLALDLGYIVLAVYAYRFGPFSAAIVGGAGCCLVSLLASGWFPIGWIAGNIFIGLTVGFFANKSHPIVAAVSSVPAVFIGIAIIKTAIECWLYAIPLEVKFAKNMVAFIADAIVLLSGCIFATILQKRLDKKAKV